MNMRAQEGTNRKSIEIFCSYAEEDEHLYQQLKTHLNLLERSNLISLWNRHEVVAGVDWGREVDTHLSSASLILLLISPNFMASDNCYSVEMKRALEQEREKKTRIIPILLRPVDGWKHEPFGRFQPLPKNSKPVTRWDRPDDAFEKIAQGIREVVKDLQDKGEQIRRAEEAKRVRLEEEQRRREARARATQSTLEAHLLSVTRSLGQQSHRKLLGKALLVLSVVSFIIVSSGILYYIKNTQNANKNTQATATANAYINHLHTHVANTSTARNAQATSTSQAVSSAQVQATSTAQAISSTQTDATSTAQAEATSTAQATFQTAIAMAQNPNPYGGKLVINDALSGPGSAFDWVNGSNGQYGQCNFKNNAYHVSGQCDSWGNYDYKKFAFEIRLVLGQNCGKVEFGGFIISVCQDGQYDLDGTIGNVGPAMYTGPNQSNTIGVVEDGTNLTLYVNYIKIVATHDNGAEAQYITLWGGDQSAGDAEVVYTNARLWSL